VVLSQTYLIYPQRTQKTLNGAVHTFIRIPASNRVPMDQGRQDSLFEAKMALQQVHTNFQRLLRPLRINNDRLNKYACING